MTDTTTAQPAQPDAKPARKLRTITLTGRPPVRIVEDDWPVMAEAARWHGEFEVQANRHWTLKVRQHHLDGRTIVYGAYRTSWQGERDLRAGQLLVPPADVAQAVTEETWAQWPALIAAVRQVCEDIGASPALAQDCLADLPPVDLTDAATAGELPDRVVVSRQLLARVLQMLDVADPEAHVASGLMRWARYVDWRHVAHEVRVALGDEPAGDPTATGQPAEGGLQ